VSDALHSFGVLAHEMKSAIETGKPIPGLLEGEGFDDIDPSRNGFLVATHAVETRFSWKQMAKNRELDASRFSKRGSNQSAATGSSASGAVDPVAASASSKSSSSSGSELPESKTELDNDVEDGTASNVVREAAISLMRSILTVDEVRASIPPPPS